MVYPLTTRTTDKTLHTPSGTQNFSMKHNTTQSCLELRCTRFHVYTVHIIFTQFYRISISHEQYFDLLNTHASFPIDEPSTIETFTSESSTIGTIIGEMSTIGTFIGVGVGSSMFLLLALSILVVIILVVVAATVKRKPTCKQTRQMAVEGPYYSTVGENPVTEMTQQGSHVHYENADSSENVHKDKIKDDGAFTDDIHMYEVVDRAVHRMTRSAPKESSSPASANNVPAVYAAVDKSKKKRAMMTGIGDNIKNSET